MNDVALEASKETGVTPTEGMLQSLIPFIIEGDKKATCLGYLVAGFSRQEAVKLTNIHRKTLARWIEEDKDFADFIEKMPEVRRGLSDQIVDLEYTRNFRLVLAKDFKVLYKDASGGKLTEQESNYLNTIRKFYTPQHMVMLRQLLAGDGKKEEAFDWTKTVLEIRLSKEESHGKRS